MSTIEDLGNAIERAIDDCPADEVLSVITGVFVSMVTSLLRCNGHDSDQEITINGGESRDITIHATKNGENHG